MSQAGARAIRTDVPERNRILKPLVASSSSASKTDEPISEPIGDGAHEFLEQKHSREMTSYRQREKRSIGQQQNGQRANKLRHKNRLFIHRNEGRAGRVCNITRRKICLCTA
eukprot:6192440-Pleurochrysis_carterae.AAC.2